MFVMAFILKKPLWGISIRIYFIDKRCAYDELCCCSATGTGKRRRALGDSEKRDVSPNQHRGEGTWCRTGPKGYLTAAR